MIALRSADLDLVQHTAVSMLSGAGRFRPTSRLAKSALAMMRRRDGVPRFITGQLRGRSIALDLDEEVDRKIFLYGSYDERGLRMLEPIIRGIACRTILDVGANIGNHVGHFCDWAGAVYAFEPNPPVYARLQAFVRENDLRNVTTIQAGLSDKDDRLTINLFPGAAGCSTFEAEPGAVAGEQVPVRVGDGLVSERGIADVDFIKIDVEGHEREVLHGLQQTIRRDAPIVTMEFTETSARKFGGLDALQALLPGYAFHGTRRGLASTYFKARFRFEPFRYSKRYAHLLCVPQHREAMFKQFL